MNTFDVLKNHPNWVNSPKNKAAKWEIYL